MSHTPELVSVGRRSSITGQSSTTGTVSTTSHRTLASVHPPALAPPPSDAAGIDVVAEFARMRADQAALLETVRAMQSQLAVLQSSPSRLRTTSSSNTQRVLASPTLKSAPSIPQISLGSLALAGDGSQPTPRVTDDELIAMRKVFALFDSSGHGIIDAKDLQALHQKLGEPITDEEAKEAVEQISRGRDVISFEQFVRYWDSQHPSSKPYFEPGSARNTTGHDEARSKKRQWYQARFKFLMAKVTPTLGRIHTVVEGECPSLEYRVRFLHDDGSGEVTRISPWHDVPYKNPEDGSYNMVVEIPKWTRAKFEIATGELYNPIKQDVKNGTLREYYYGDMMWNYGAIPQTYEDPKVVHPDTGAVGDSDPIDILDIGIKQWTTGSIVRVKVLGILAMLDAGETDWKVIAINVQDPLASLLNDIDDVKVHLPGCLEAIHRWLMLYKSPAVNTFAFDGKPQDRKFAISIIEETHKEWRQLIEDRGKSATVAK